MATKTFTVTRTRIDNSVPFFKTHYISTQPNSAVATREVADLEAWIKSRPGIISYNDGAEDGAILVFQVVYDNAIVSSVPALVESYPGGLARAAVDYYNTPAVSAAILLSVEIT